MKLGIKMGVIKKSHVTGKETEHILSGKNREKSQVYEKPQPEKEKQAHRHDKRP